MKEETNNIIQGLLFLSTKYPDGKIKGGDNYISFLLPKNYNPLEVENITLIESLGWNECEIDLCTLFSQTWVSTAWIFYTSPIVEDFEDEKEWENI